MPELDQGARADRLALLGSRLHDSVHTSAAGGRGGPLLSAAAAVVERTPLLYRDPEKSFADTT